MVDNRMSVHENFRKRVEDFIKEFRERVGIKISTTEATKLIDEKIKGKGGLKVPTWTPIKNHSPP